MISIPGPEICGLAHRLPSTPSPLTALRTPPDPTQAESEGPQPAFIYSGHFDVQTDG